MLDTRVTMYAIIALLLTAVDLHFAVKAFRKTDKIGRSMGWSAVCAAGITAAYLVSVSTRNDWVISIFSSLTFIGIDCMLVSLLYFAFLITGNYKKRVSRVSNNIIRALAAADAVVLAANVFTGAAVGFELLEPYGVGYQMKTPYIIHLVFTYTMVVLVLTVLIHKSVLTPRQYRNQYLLIIAAIGVVVLINAIFLFQDRGSFFTKIDCSTFGYSIGLFLMYWTAYDYRQNDMLNSLSKRVMENVDQGIVLFDYADRFIMSNHRIRALLKGVRLENGMTGADFREAVGVEREDDGEFSIRCDIDGCVPLRCDYRKLRDDRDGVIGSLYVFTDISREKDITTGFEYARDFASVGGPAIPEPATAVVFDIIGLSRINRIEGRDAGDRAIRSLAKRMRAHMPKDAAFLRGAEANLIALCPGVGEEGVVQSVERVASGGGQEVAFGLSSTEGRTLSEALELAQRSVQIKKLLNPNSWRSQALASLVRALKEADADTEDHVRRTQKMGALLGERIHLADVERTQLELLCLLHDIGKVGIPLEILNKPGRLADQEWEVLRTHPDKGYQIAMSSDELKPIADMIRYHHERWDGRGYPAGLKGEEIPVLSRIISIVDAYDAMVNDRSYRKALTAEKAQQEIQDNAGTQFDPKLAAEFLKLLEERPELAVGEKVSGDAAESVVSMETEAELTGTTLPIPYSRYLLDVGDGIIEVDDRFEELTGYSREEAVGRMNQIDLIPPEHRGDYMLQVGNQFSHGSMAYLRHEILRRDGERIQVACYGRRYYDSAAKTFRNEIIIFRL